jgi:hypothetical protein
VAYSAKDAVPIDIGGRNVGAYLIALVNTSKHVVKDLACHVEAAPAKLRNGGISAPQGLQYTIDDDGDNGFHISIPYLKADDKILMTVIAEALLYIPKTPNVAIRSPFELDVVTIDPDSKQTGFRGGFIAAALISTLVGALAAQLFWTRGNGIYADPQDVLTFAASVAGLPHLADLYATASSNIHYYNQGDLACAWAASSSDRGEIQKYRKLLSITLDAAPRMLSESRANLFYSLGKIDILLGDKDAAIREFGEAVREKKSIVDEKSRVDPAVHEFLAANPIR